MTEMQTSAVLAESPKLLEISGDRPDEKRGDLIRRFDIAQPWTGPLRISAEVRSEGITGVPGTACFVFFNVEYESGPIFWDTFLYPDTGRTPWQAMSTHALARGRVRTVELHIRLAGKGKLYLRNLRIEGIEPWTTAPDVSISVFGDSTDMTCYLPHDLRTTRRLELLLRDRFPDRLIDVHCHAEGGDFLKRLLDTGRLQRELEAVPACDIALFRYGLNDVAQNISDDDFAQQLRAAQNVVAAKFPQARVALSTTIPGKADRFSRQSEAVAKELGLPLIDLNTFIRSRSAAGDANWHFQDGSRVGRANVPTPGDPTGLAGDMHPNALGAQMIAECYFEKLEAIVEKKLGR